MYMYIVQCQILHRAKIAVSHQLPVKIRDGNWTEPEPNTPNSNPILRPFRTEPNEPKVFDNRTRTEPNYHNDRTEQNPNLRC